MQFVWCIPAVTTTKDERRKTCRDFVPTKNQYVATVMQDHIVGGHIYIGGGGSCSTSLCKHHDRPDLQTQTSDL